MQSRPVARWEVALVLCAFSVMAIVAVALAGGRCERQKVILEHRIEGLQRHVRNLEVERDDLRKMANR